METQLKKRALRRYHRERINKKRKQLKYKDKIVDSENNYKKYNDDIAKNILHEYSNAWEKLLEI